MKNALREISSLLKQALAVAETVDHFKGAVVSLDLSCFDGSTAAVTETIDNPGDDTDNSGSSISHTPRQKSLVDQLGDIKTNTWF
ncbi:hypothetical protein [Marinobacter orientalis]|uniref:Uncharacterized protein n=1 Tax=Marinobacter orientalis TaxID=1928859 RepID=A0A7Y0NKC3_9GAMM|nr:hypothetical protein [Marinobacter orientalis]NMT62778.1 hypothetical protein [Marinobacter orientalis]TGX51457.1 hypothetical protein DIT72_05380 [Marinobacter orientalis]